MKEKERHLNATEIEMAYKHDRLTVHLRILGQFESIAWVIACT